MLGYENEAKLFQIFLDLNILDYEYINSPLILFAITNIDTLEKNAAKIQKEPVGGLGGGNFEHNFPTSLSSAKYFQHFSTHASPLHSSPKESKQKWKWWILCPTIDQH